MDPRVGLLSTVLAALLDEWRASSVEQHEAIWVRARAALDVSEGEGKEPEISAALDRRDTETLDKMVLEWTGGARILPRQDLAVLRRAMKAFKKRLKLTRLDDESRIGGRAMSAGHASGIVAVVPPNQYPSEVWEALARLGRLVSTGRGMYELPPHGSDGD